MTWGGHTSTSSVATTTQAACTIVSPPQVTQCTCHYHRTGCRHHSNTTTDSPIQPQIITHTIEIQTYPGLLVRGDWPLDEEVPPAGLQETRQPIQAVECQFIQAVEPPLTQEVENTREVEPQPIQAPELPLIQMTESPPLEQRTAKEARKEKYCKDILPSLEELAQAPVPAEADRQLSLASSQQLEEPVVAPQTDNKVSNKSSVFLGRGGEGSLSRSSSKQCV